MLIRAAALMGALFVLVPAFADDKKDDGKVDEKLFVGKWNLTKTSQGDLPEGLKIVLEVEKDGKFQMISMNGDEKSVDKGKWKIEGKKFVYEFTEGTRKGMKATDTIKELTAKKLVLVDEKDITEDWERVEEKKK